MSALIFAFVATLVAGIGARDQLLVAALAARRGQRPAALIVALCCVTASVSLAAGLAGLTLPRMDGAQRQMFAALALGLAGIEMLLARRSQMPAEPTDSLGAFAIVLFARQLTDATRLLVFAIAAASRDEVTTALGGILGGAGVVAAGWAAGNALAGRNLVSVRRILGLAVLAAGSWLGLSAI